MLKRKSMPKIRLERSGGTKLPFSQNFEHTRVHTAHGNSASKKDLAKICAILIKKHTFAFSF
jgi:hypothetical protein